MLVKRADSWGSVLATPNRAAQGQGRARRTLGALVATLALGAGTALWLWAGHGTSGSPHPRANPKAATAPRSGLILPAQVTAAWLGLKAGGLCPSTIRPPSFPPGATVETAPGTVIVFGDFWQAA